MTTSPVTSVTDELIAELEALAVSVKGWNLPHAFQEPEEGFLPQDWEWHVGQIDEEGNRYPVLNANAHQYDSDDSEKLARYYAACNRDTILALLAEREELKRDAKESYLRGLTDQKATFESAYSSTDCWVICESKTSDGLRAMDAAIDAAMQS